MDSRVIDIVRHFARWDHGWHCQTVCQVRPIVHIVDSRVIDTVRHYARWDCHWHCQTLHQVRFLLLKIWLILVKLGWSKVLWVLWITLLAPWVLTLEAWPYVAVKYRAVVKVRRSTLERHSTTSKFSRAALRHMYVCRGELRSCTREGRGGRVQICGRLMTKKGHEKVKMAKKGHQNFRHKNC